MTAVGVDAGGTGDAAADAAAGVDGIGGVGYGATAVAVAADGGVAAVAAAVEAAEPEAVATEYGYHFVELYGSWIAGPWTAEP